MKEQLIAHGFLNKKERVSSNMTFIKDRFREPRLSDFLCNREMGESLSATGGSAVADKNE